MLRRLSSVIFFFCAISVRAQAPPVEPQPTKLTPEDLARGKQLFEAQCAPCHGMMGTGGTGANLARATLKHAADDAGLFSLIRHGIENTAMPNFWQMTDRELWLVVAHVRSLGRAAVEKLPGDPNKGKDVYAAQQCRTCHIVKGAGGTVGPDLTEVGARRSAERLRQALLTPGSALPDGFVMIRAVAADGIAVEGIRANEDSFSIQLRDLAGRFHSFRKQELRELKYKREATPMPSYGEKLSPTELDDVIAYLATLRGKP